MVFVFLLGLVVIWAHELQAFAVSLVALAAALCWPPRSFSSVGARALRSAEKCTWWAIESRLPAIGASCWIMIFLRRSSWKSVRGSTSHLYTGRVTVFPNSLLFTNALVKENPNQEYGLYTLTVPLASGEDWKQAEVRLLEAGRAECASFMTEASRQMKLLEQQNLLEAPSPEPRITIQLSDVGPKSCSCCVSPPLTEADRALSRRFCGGF